MAGFFPNPHVPGLEPNATRGPELVGASLTMIILSFIAIVLRFTSRWLVDTRLLLDDWLIFCALPFAWAEGIVDINGTYHFNFGQHISHATPSTLESILAATWAFQLLYNFAIAFSKLSILALYWRIFHVPSFKIPLIIATSLVMSWLIGCTFAAIFSCSPVNGFWKITERSHCINNIVFYVGQAAVNIIIDIILMSLPVFMISRLQISLSQKIAVMGIFLLGAFVTLASALRLWQLITTQRLNDPLNFDPTWNLVGAAVWSVIECNLSIVCACLPIMRPLLRLILHGTLRNTEVYDNSYASGRSAQAAGGAFPLGPGPSKRASRTWDRGIQPGTASKRSSFLRIPSRDVKTDARGVSIDDDGFRISKPEFLGGRLRSKSLKTHAEEGMVELEGTPVRPRPMPRAITSPTPGTQEGVSAMNWFDAGAERVSESSDEISVAVNTTRVESPIAKGPRSFSRRSISPIQRLERPSPLLVGGPSLRENRRAMMPADPWGLEIEKTTDLIITEDRRR